jgi:hypothetical protein
MVAAISVVSVILSVAVAHFADRVPTHIEMLEICAGVLLIGGLGLLGSGLPIIL